ncbi:Gfo/Idh/MocA family protein [Agathobaculum sp. Marseille-P7918]|uniref:Gfo/Idh/MocA family protein n=1 Tax=Agathobaculum sp. Marseille-P7918 TaxID=2479843 RepID=UPI003563582E
MDVALLGYGYWGQIIEKYIHKSPTMNLKKIYVRSMQKHEGDIFTDDLNSIMHASEIEAVFICLPSSLHYDICKMALQSNKHVFCEKPLVKYNQNHQELVELAQNKQKVLFTDYIYTVSPSIQLIKERLHLLGNICLIEGQLLQFGKFYQGDSIWENIGIHLVSVICTWFPDIQIEKIQRTGHKNVHGQIESVLLEDAHGMQVKLECSLLCPQKKRCIYIYGEKGSICFDMLDPDATIRQNLYELNQGGCELQSTRSWKYDEQNNLVHAISFFEAFIRSENYQSNLHISQKVHRLLCDIITKEE